MDKKVVIIASAVLAFFAGAIWVSEVPVVATLVAFLEVCAGFACGFFYHKVLVDKYVLEIKEELESLKSATLTVKEEVISAKEEVKSVESATKTIKKASKKSKKDA